MKEEGERREREREGGKEGRSRKESLRDLGKNSRMKAKSFLHSLFFQWNGIEVEVF